MEVSICPVGADRCVGPDTLLRGTHSRADTQVRPYAGEWKVPATTQPSGAQRSVCAADGRKGLESRQRSSPKCPATSDNPSVTAAPCQLPLHKGAFGDGGCGLPRRPVGPPRNDNGFLSFRGAERRGNPYFYDGRGFGPPYLGHGLRRPNFVPKFGASVKSSAPTGPRDCRGSALSAERAAGQIRFLPDNIRVQHGVQRSEASAKPRPCSRRGCVN